MNTPAPTPTIYEFAVIACTRDGAILCGSGYRGIEAVKRATAERAAYHFSGSTKLRSILIVRGDGQTVTEVPPSLSDRHNNNTFVLDNPADRRRFQNWYADETGRPASW